jgi:hypothetical protein
MFLAQGHLEENASFIATTSPNDEAVELMTPTLTFRGHG